MKQNKYIAPAMEVTEVKLEGMIAASLPIGSTGGDQQLVKDGDSWDIWGQGE